MDLLLSLHIVAAIVIIGPLVFVTSITARLLRSGAPALPVLRVAARVTRGYGAAAVLVLLLGAGLVQHRYGYSFGQTWVWASVLLFVVALGLEVGVVGAAQRRAIATLDAGGDAAGQAGLTAAAAGVAALAWVVIVFLMVFRPGG